MARGVADLSHRQLWDAVARATSITREARTDQVARWVKIMYTRDSVSISSLAGTLRVMYDRGYLGMKKRKTAVNPSEHDAWWCIAAPPDG